MAHLVRLAPRLFGIRTPWTPSQTCLMSSTLATSTSGLSAPVTKEAWHKDYNPSLEDQSFTHEDRTIGFAEYGSQTGVPAFLFHGAPGSRYDGIVYHDSAKKLDIRIICPDRPGHGLSSFVPDRRLVNYPSDVSALAKHLKLGPYHVFGQSGGGPYSVACAALTPGDELLNVAVVAGMGPPEAITLKKAGWYTVTALWLHIHAPGLLKRLCDWFFPLSSLQDDKKLQSAIDRTLSWLPAETRKELENLKKPEVQREFRALLQCMFAQGWDGTIRDGQIYASPWGFKLEDVTKKVLLIYGGKDIRTPVAFAEWFKEHLADAEMVVYEGDGHITIGERVDEILAKLVGKEDLLKRVLEAEAHEKEKDIESKDEKSKVPL